MYSNDGIARAFGWLRAYLVDALHLSPYFELKEKDEASRNLLFA